MLLCAYYCWQARSSTSKNIFNNLPDLALASSVERDELDHYLLAEMEDVKDGLMWWFERRSIFPRLSCMACDYLLIPGRLRVFLSRCSTYSDGYLKLLLSMWNVFSPMADLCSLMYAAASMSNPLEHLCALEHGVYLV